MLPKWLDPGKVREPFAVYAARSEVNISNLLMMAVSPKHYRHASSNRERDTQAYKIGRATHTAILEPMEFLRAYALSPYSDMRTKEARAWRDEQSATGKTVLTDAEYRLAERMREAVEAHVPARSHLRDGVAEATLAWQDPRTGIACRGRIDYLNSAVVDLKTTRHPSPWGFGKDAARLSYYVRLAWYQDAVRRVFGIDAPAVIIAIESRPPHDVAVYRLRKEDLDAGRKKYEALLDDLRMCLDSDTWPGVAEECEIDLELPGWITGLDRSEDSDLSGLGLEMEDHDEAH